MTSQHSSASSSPPPPATSPAQTTLSTEDCCPPSDLGSQTCRHGSMTRRLPRSSAGPNTGSSTGWSVLPGGTLTEAVLAHCHANSSLGRPAALRLTHDQNQRGAECFVMHGHNRRELTLAIRPDRREFVLNRVQQRRQQILRSFGAEWRGQRRRARRTTPAMCGLSGGGSIRGSTAGNSIMKSPASSRARSSAPT